jgi:glutaredoxin-like protein NrdH
MTVKLYALSTCPYCKMTKKFLTENGIDFDATDVDLLDGESNDPSSPKGEAVAEVKRLSGGTSFPVVQVDDEVVVGFNKVRLGQLLGIES